MLAGDHCVGERSAVGWQVAVDGSEGHDAGARRLVLQDVTQRQRRLEQRSVVVDIVDVDMHLTGTGLRRCAVVDGADGDVVDALRFAIERRRRFDGAAVGVDFEGRAPVAAQDRVGELVVGRPHVFVDGDYAADAAAHRCRLGDVRLVDRLQEYWRIVTVLDGDDHL